MEIMQIFDEIKEQPLMISAKVGKYNADTSTFQADLRTESTNARLTYDNFEVYTLIAIHDYDFHYNMICFNPCSISKVFSAEKINDTYVLIFRVSKNDRTADYWIQIR